MIIPAWKVLLQNYQIRIIKNTVFFLISSACCDLLGVEFLDHDFCDPNEDHGGKLGSKQVMAGGA
jgi:hypothetical protein